MLPGRVIHPTGAISVMKKPNDLPSLNISWVMNKYECVTLKG